MGTFVGANGNGGNVAALTTANSFPVTWPAGVQAGDLAILAWSFGDSTVTVTSDPTGFTLVSQTNDGNLQSRILRRTCTGTESGALSGWLLSLANRQSAVLYVVRGYGSVGGFTSRAETVTGTSHDCPAITTASGAANGDSIIIIGADRAGSTAASPPAGFSERTGSEAVAAGTGGTITTIADDGLSTGATLPVDPAAFTGYVSSGTAVTWTIALRPAGTSHTGAGDRSASGTLTGLASLAKSAVGTLAAVAALTGAATGIRPALGDVVVTALTTGAASVVKTGAGTRSATATLTGAADVVKAAQEATGNLAATAGITGAAAVTQSAGGNRSTTASLAGAAELTRTAAGELSASATLAGGVTLERSITGDLEVAASLTGEAETYGHFDPAVTTTATARAMTARATARPTSRATARRPLDTATVRSPE